MKSLEQTIKDVERDLVINMVLSVRHGRISLKEAGSLSKNFINGSPIKDYEDLFGRLLVLSNKYKEARKVYVKYSPGYEEEITGGILKTMRNYMKNNDFENAIKIAKGEIYGTA